MKDSDQVDGELEPRITIGTVDEFAVKGLMLPGNLTHTENLRPGDKIALKASTATALALRVLAYWSVPESDWVAILGTSPERLADYRSGGYPTFPPELKRVEDLLVIHVALTVLFPDEAARRAWCTRPNTFFDSRMPVEVMVKGGSAAVRHYLEGALGS